MPLSVRDRRDIAARATNIYQRAAALTPAARGAAGPASERAASEVQAWNRAFAPGNAPAFAARLAWDGLDLPTALAAAADPDPETIDAAWIDWIDRVFDAARGVGADLAAGAFADDLGTDLPFVEVWTAFRRVAAAAVDWPTILGPAARRAFERQLCVELSRHGELTVFEYFQRELATGSGAPGRDGYRAFAISVLDQGLAPLFLEYPVLARRLAGLTRDWVDSTEEFLGRLIDDHTALAQTFGPDLGPVVTIEPGLSDPHFHRRRVAVVCFESGCRVVYKPRSLQLDLAFRQLVEWMNDAIALPLRTLLMVDRGSHGWVECAIHEPMADRQQAAASFRRCGTLLCLAWVLGARDLHMENLVTTSFGPVLVDTEMLFQAPPSLGSPDDDDRTDADCPEESVLASGLLSLLEVTDEGEVYDSGGMRGTMSGPLPFPARTWRQLGTAEMHWVEESTYVSAARYLVMLNGTPQDPSGYENDILEGFREAYLSLMERRATLLSVDGPLEVAAPASVRVLLRPTNQYAMLTVVLAKPKYLRSGVSCSTAVDVLHRNFAGASQVPAQWPAVIAERAAIDRLDVPLFTARCGDVHLYCEDRVVVADYLGCSGLAAARGRVGALSESHLRLETRRLAFALRETTQARFSADGPRVDGSATQSIAQAEWIARELLSRASRSEDGLTWRAELRGPETGWQQHRLYDGSLGPALLLAGLAAVRADREWREHAIAALRPIMKSLACEPAGHGRENIGGTDGLGSIIYGLTIASALLGDEAGLDLAQSFARRLARSADASSSSDIVGGTAGAILALLAIFDATHDGEALRIAAECGGHLLRRESDDGAPDRARLVGFAHGAAGVGTALGRLFRATDEEQFRHAAAARCRFVAGQFLPASGNYSTAGTAADGLGSSRAMMAWCHGAPGVLLGLVPMLDICAETAMLSQLDAAMQAIAGDHPAQVDHVCCGAFGRIESLLVCGRARQRPDLVTAAGRLAEIATTRAQRRGHFRLSGPGVEYRVSDPGFFRGLSGIGYGWLRLAAPDRVPSIAGFESLAL